MQAWPRRLQDGDDGEPRDPWASLRPIDEHTGRPADAWRAHDLRRAFSTRMHGFGVAPHVIERMLNHIAGTVASIYNRAEYEQKRIELARLWVEEIARIAPAQTVR